MAQWTHTDYVLRRMPREGFDRKYRLFAVASYRICLKRYDAYEHHLDMAERYAEGLATAEEMLALPQPTADQKAGILIITHPGFTAFEAAWHATGLVMSCSPKECRIPDRQARVDTMCALLRDIFGFLPEPEE